MTDRPRPSAIPDVYVLVRRASSILLLHRAGTGYKDGQWGPPAGKVEAGETYVEAAQRELFEEVGLSVPAADLRFVHVIDRMPSGGGSRWIGLFFEVDCGGREPFNAEPGKHAALAFFDRSELPADTVDYVRHAIEAIEQGQRFSHWEYPETEDG